MSVLLATKLRNMLKEADPTLDGATLKNIRVNGSNRGCSGFIVGAKRTVYVSTEESVYGPLQGKILYREAKDTKDYTGFTNQWSTPDELVRNITNLLNK